MDPFLDVGIHRISSSQYFIIITQSKHSSSNCSAAITLKEQLTQENISSAVIPVRPVLTQGETQTLNKLTENSAFEVYYSSFSPNECFIYITKIIVVEIDFLSTVLLTRVDSQNYSCFQGIIYPGKFDHHLEMKNFDAYSCSLKFRRNHSNSL